MFKKNKSQGQEEKKIPLISFQYQNRYLVEGRTVGDLESSGRSHLLMSEFKAEALL